MLNKSHIAPPFAAQRQVLEALRGGAYTWDEIQSMTEFNNDYLGLVIGELLGQRKVRTGHKNEVRFYWLARDSAGCPTPFQSFSDSRDDSGT